MITNRTKVGEKRKWGYGCKTQHVPAGHLFFRPHSAGIETNLGCNGAETCACAEIKVDLI